MSFAPKPLFSGNSFPITLGALPIGPKEVVLAVTSQSSDGNGLARLVGRVGAAMGGVFRILGSSSPQLPPAAETPLPSSFEASELVTLHTQVLALVETDHFRVSAFTQGIEHRSVRGWILHKAIVRMAELELFEDAALLLPQIPSDWERAEAASCLALAMAQRALQNDKNDSLLLRQAMEIADQIPSRFTYPFFRSHSDIAHLLQPRKEDSGERQTLKLGMRQEATRFQETAQRAAVGLSSSWYAADSLLKNETGNIWQIESSLQAIQDPDVRAYVSIQSIARFVKKAVEKKDLGILTAAQETIAQCGESYVEAYRSVHLEVTVQMAAMGADPLPFFNRFKEAATLAYEIDTSDENSQARRIALLQDPRLLFKVQKQLEAIHSPEKRAPLQIDLAVKMADEPKLRKRAAGLFMEAARSVGRMKTQHREDERLVIALLETGLENSPALAYDAVAWTKNPSRRDSDAFHMNAAGRKLQEETLEACSLKMVPAVIKQAMETENPDLLHQAVRLISEMRNHPFYNHVGLEVADALRLTVIAMIELSVQLPSVDLFRQATDVMKIEHKEIGWSALGENRRSEIIAKQKEVLEQMAKAIPDDAPIERIYEGMRWEERRYFHEDPQSDFIFIRRLFEMGLATRDRAKTMQAMVLLNEKGTSTPDKRWRDDLLHQVQNALALGQALQDRQLIQDCEEWIRKLQS
jgi:hypothetical protein